MKRIISMLLILTTLFTTFAINVSAARAEEYVSEVALVYGDSLQDVKVAIAGTDWRLFDQDLNAKADYMIDDGVYLIYKTSTDVEDAITDLRVMDMYGGYATSNYDKQLEASRAAYLRTVKYIRTAAAEFKALFEAGDEMAKIAYRQMNYYKDIGESNMLMGDFMLNIPSDDALVTVMMEGNGYVITNLVSLLAISLSGTDGKTLAEKVAEKYAIKDTLTDIDYYDAASKLTYEFKELAARVKRYNALSNEYDLKDEEMNDEEAEFVIEYASVAMLLEQIPYGNETLKDFIVRDGWAIKDLYPVVAALSPGQQALAETGVLTTVLQYGPPTKSIDELYEILEEAEKEMKDEKGNIKLFDVYTGVDRSIFEGNFAFTNAAERQQALTGKEWTSDYYLDNVANDNIPYTAVKALIVSGITVAFAPLGLATFTGWRLAVALAAGIDKSVIGASVWGKLAVFLMGKQPGEFLGFAGATKVGLFVGAGLLATALGVIGISIWYGYYNPDYTPIPNTMVDVRSTDLGDRYIKYTAAKVFEDGKLSEKNADFNAYQGKEWNALYYTKDAQAGNCLTPYFVFKDNDNSIARRHQGVSMFGEDKAFNLNSHVFSSEAKGAYLTVRYSTAKKAAADVPTVVGSMLAQGALYTLTALAGAGLGVGGTILFQNAKKKKKETKLESENSN